MPIVKKSFISNIIGENTYEQFAESAKVIVKVGTCLLALFIGLSLAFHSSIINWFLQLLTGTSLLFIAYVAAMIIVLDIQVNVDEPEHDVWEKPEKIQRPTSYKLTIVWGLFLITSGISAIYFSNKYRKLYAFECNTFLVDIDSGIYHLNDDYIDCETAEQGKTLIPMKGYQLDKRYKLCKECQDLLYEIESEDELIHAKPD